jgi:hypothetical protein
MAYYYELCESLANPYLLLMTCKSAETYEQLLDELRASGRITYQTEYVIQVGHSVFSLDSIVALYNCKQRNVPIYYLPRCDDVR